MSSQIQRPVVCPVCEESFQGIANHWAGGKCTYPTPTPAQRDALATLLSFGGAFRQSKGRAALNYSTPLSEKRPVLDELSDVLGVLAVPVSEYTPSRRDKTMHRLITRPHPILSDSPNPEEMFEQDPPLSHSRQDRILSWSKWERPSDLIETGYID